MSPFGEVANRIIPGSSDPHLGDGVGDDQISFSVGPDDVHADPGRSLRKHGAPCRKEITARSQRLLDLNQAVILIFA